MEKKNEIEFDLVELLLFLKKRIWIVALAVVVCALGGFVGSKLFTTPKYTAAARLWVYRQTDQVSASGMQTATQLRRDCEILIAGENVTEKVIEQLDLNMSPASLSRRIKVTTKDNTRVIGVEFTDTNPERAALILNTICKVATDEINGIIGGKNGTEENKEDVITVVYEAAVPTAPSSRGAKTIAILAAALGGILSLGVLVVIFMVDDTIRTEDDVERYLGLSTLAVIPVSAELGTVKKPKGGKK